MEFLKKIFSKHEYEYVGKIKHINADACLLSRIPHSEWENYPEYMEYVYICKKCGKKRMIKI